MSFELIGASCERRGHLGCAAAALLARSLVPAVLLITSKKKKMLIHQAVGEESRQSRMTYCSASRGG